MLLSLRQRFIFISNMKAASTTIETALQAYAEIQRVFPTNGKHFSMAKLRNAFPAIFESPHFQEESFVKFGVVREPRAWLCSWFNYRSREALSDPGHPQHDQYCGDRSFTEFAEEVVHEDPRPFGRLRPQSKLLTTKGDLDCDFIIEFEKLDEDFLELLSVLEIERGPLGRRDVRNRTATHRIKPDDIDWSGYDFLLEFLARDEHVREAYLEQKPTQAERCRGILENRPDAEAVDKEIPRLLQTYWESFAASVLHGPTEGVDRRALEREIGALDKSAFLAGQLVGLRAAS